MVVNNVPKSFVKEQFSIKRSTLYDNLKIKENLKKSRKRGAELLLFIMHCMLKLKQLNYFIINVFFSGTFTENLAQHVRIRK